MTGLKRMKEQYDKIKDKYSLPDYTVMDTEFEISGIESEDHYLRNVRRKMVEKIEKVLGILDDVLHPESSWSSMVEEKVFSEEEENKMLEKYKKLRYYYRRNTELRIMDSDDANVKFIKEFFTEWKNMQKESLTLISKLKDAWTKKTIEKEKLGYLG